MKTQSRSIPILAFALMWMVAVLLFYYWIHKPLTPRLAVALGGALLDFSSAAILLLVGGGLGRFTLKRVFPTWHETLSPAECLAGEALIGLGSLALAIFLVGLFNLSAWSMLLLLLVLAAITRQGLHDWLNEAWRSLQGLDLSRPWQRGLFFFIAANLLMAWFMALSPPTTFDALTYHLVGGKLWLQEGHFSALEGNHFFAFPQLVNTLYTGQMALLFGRLSGAAAIHWEIGLLFLVATAGYGKRRFNAFVGLLAAAILLSATSIWLQFGYAYVDLFPAACGMLTFIALDEWRRSDKIGWIVLAGLFTGLAMSCKYNAALLGIAGGMYIFCFGWQMGMIKVTRSTALFALVATLTLAPWLLRNWAFYHNPIYPFGALAGEWDALSREWYTSSNAAPLRETPYFVLPIFLTPTFLGVEGAGLFSATIGPLFLLLIPFLLMTWRQINDDWRRSLGGLLLLVVVFHSLWVIAGGVSVYGIQTRLMYAMFGWLALLAAAAVDSLNKLPLKPINFAWMVRTIVALVLVLTFIDHISGTRPHNDEGVLEGSTLESHFLETRSLEYVFGILSKQAYLEDRLGWYITAMDQVNKLPQGSRVLFLWETRSLYCDEKRVTCEEDTILERWWHDRRSVGEGSSAEILENWRAHGLDYVLIWESGQEFEFDSNEFFTQADKAEWDVMESLLEPVWQGDEFYTLYRIS